MYPVSARYLEAIRAGHTMLARVEVWLAGSQVIANLPYLSGEVTLSGTGGVHGTLALTVAKGEGTATWDLLSPIGTELIPYRGVRFIDGTTEWVPLGVFGIDSQRMGYGVDGTITLTAPDRWARVQRARFLMPTVTTGGAVAEAIRLTTGAVNVAATDATTSAATTNHAVWDRDRDAAVTDLMKAASAEIFFDRSGLLVARDVPRLTSVPVWAVDASQSGVLVTADRERSRARTYNAVVVYAEDLTGPQPWPPQRVYDDDANSPTYYLGGFGSVPYFYSSPLLTTAAQALAAAKTILAKTTGMAAQVSIESAVNAALDSGDTIAVVLPGGTVEAHLIDTVTIPLDVGTSQKITTRSTRPEGDVPA